MGNSRIPGDAVCLRSAGGHLTSTSFCLSLKDDHRVEVAPFLAELAMLCVLSACGYHAVDDMQAFVGLEKVLGENILFEGRRAG